MLLITIISLVKFLILIPLTSALQCNEGVLAVDENLPSTPQINITECPENAAFQCRRLEATLTIGSDVIASYDFAVGICSPADFCSLSCDQAFRNIFVSSGFGNIDLNHISLCDSICCATDNCNNQTVEGIRGQTLPDAQTQSVPLGLYSLSNPAYHIGHTRGIARIANVGSESFRLITPGLDNTPESVSFRLEGKQGHFLRIQDGKLLVQGFTNDRSFDRDATFILHFNHFYKGYDAYESANNPNNFIMYGPDGRLITRPGSRSTSFRKRASFKAVTSVSSSSDPIRIHSLANPTLCIGSGIHSAKGRVAMLQDCDSPSLETFRLVSPGLHGTPGSVSILSSSNSEQYLVHEDHVLAYRPLVDNVFFKRSATFIPQRNLFFPGYISFESVNLAFQFITLQDRALVLSLVEDNDNFRKSASFAAVNA